MSSFSTVSVLGALLTCCGPIVPQNTTTRIDDHPVGRTSHAMAYDAARGRVVLFGGSDGAALAETWEWNGVEWRRLSPPIAPGARWGHRMAYDPVRERVVLFGGQASAGAAGFLGDTWEWDGRDWIQRSPARAPSPRGLAAMAWDAVRQGVILFGGADASRAYRETWEWTGSDWNLVATTGPSARSGHAMAVHGQTLEIVLVGGASGGAVLDDTWLWNGTGWRRAGTGPPVLVHHAMAHDAARAVTVVYGGLTIDDFGQLVQANWFGEWNGTSWTRVPAQGLPRHEHALAYDSRRARIVAFGGWHLLQQGGGFVPSDRTFECHPGSGFRDVSPRPKGFADGDLHVAYDAARRRVLVYDGGVDSGETWVFDSALDRWTKLPVGATTPGRRRAAAFVYDRARDRAVLFGGNTAETWEWDGAAWRQATPVTSPPWAFGHAMVYDTHRQVAVLFGGFLGLNWQTDVWEWDGAAWTRTASGLPSLERRDHAMAYDEARRRVVVFGGTGPTGALADTLEWNGTTWTFMNPPNAPPPGLYEMAYDPARRRVVMFGEHASQGGTLWEWDGADWTQAFASPALDRRSFGLVYDEGLRGLVVHGGSRRSQVLFDTWLIGPRAPARFEPFGTGCAGSAGVPELVTDAADAPWVGEPFEMRVLAAPVAQPVIVLLGLSDRDWNGSALPLALDGLGLFGCTLYVAPLLALPADGRGVASIFVPAVPAIVGGRFYAQAFARSPGSNPAEVVVSSAGAATIGVER